MILLVKLILAHLVGDFLIQPDSWVAEKELKKHRSAKLYLHVLLHGAATWLLIWNFSFWLPILIIVITHYLIDLGKVSFQNAGNRPTWFIIDQLLHLAVLILIWYAWERPDFATVPIPHGHALIIVTAAVLLTSPTSVIIKTTISQWTPETFQTVSASLPDAGKFIGYLERLLILLFILFDHWEAVGFLLAAKSVFRFGNLKESHDRKLTEYVLIGTLLSFGIALVISLFASYILTINPIE